MSREGQPPEESLDSFAFEDGSEFGQELYTAHHQESGVTSTSFQIQQNTPQFGELSTRSSGRKRASNGAEKPGKASRTKPSPSVTSSTSSGVGRGKTGRKPGKVKASATRGKVGKGKAAGKGDEDVMDDEKREERNLREKERSFKISRQIQMLRDLLNNGGVAVPKGTKSSVLTEAANYIRALQQHRFNSEIDRQNLVNKIRSMNSGEMGPQVQVAVRETVDTIDETSAVSAPLQPQHLGMGQAVGAPEVLPSGQPVVSLKPQPQPQNPSKLHPDDYSTLFNCSTIPMAITTMGGSFIECNKAFEDVSGFPKSVLLTMTIFNVTSPPSLQEAFESISKMIPRGTVDAHGRLNEETAPPVMLSGLLKNGECRLKVFLAKDGAGNTKYFVVQPTPSRVQITQFPTLLENDFLHITG
mmetsp:Transcript_21143/g.44055  ORF Transcript_21143/g.44055 Transcript_21143/m.44055 type:complete len:414 (-) Transcript_21143:284-1525(-)|eukprot:CAMPEP_0118654656 /NCGR_PEP_ID=MMETSP0785-20121206/12509_1 /TAXON_ID=91992 /ORGANISM="Bolidomonas pacifica, Strain CCMP 1866" /LENGTH=413 /DNA_ID=CAMNT_0006547337 /DNA_START=271 /DNA_END=1512 /DNA_ORIENTATION=+